MTQLNQIYKCNVCGNMVEVVHAGAGQLVCCNQPMQQMTENTEDAAQEKHLPVIEKTANGVKVKVGSIDHPMEEKHYIEWIEVHTEGKCHRQFLQPGQKPETEFSVKVEKVTAREYCNLHGLWKAE